MLKSRPLSALTRSVPFALLAVAALLSGSASADEGRGPAAPPVDAFEPVAAADAGGLVESGDLEESSYDIPGQIVVDARDDLDPSALSALAGDFSLSFTPTALFAETKEEIASVPVGRMDEVLAKLRHDPRVELAEPLAQVRAFFVP